MERWGEHPEYLGYWFSTEGRAWRKGYVASHGGVRKDGKVRTRVVEDHFITPGRGTQPYPLLRVSVLQENGERRSSTRLLHLLVMETFVGPKSPGQHTRHLNGNPWDSRLVNLAYGSPGDNAQDALTHGRNARSAKTRCPLGHLYLGPNLYRPTTRTQRVCIACRRARKHVKTRGISPDTKYFEDIAALKYEELMLGFVLPEGERLWLRGRRSRLETRSAA